MYGAAQLSGATCAAFTLRILLHPIKHLGTTTPSGSDFQALVMEIVVTFSMMFVTAAVATDTKAVRFLTYTNILVKLHVQLFMNFNTHPKLNEMEIKLGGRLEFHSKFKK